MRLPFSLKQGAAAFAFQSPVSAWDAALDLYERTHLTWNTHIAALCKFEHSNRDRELSDPEHVRLENVSGEWRAQDADALRLLMQVPAPTLADALLKLDLALENGEEGGAAIALEDLRRLAGISRPDINAFRRA